MAESLQRRTLHRAAELLGGVEALGAVLEVNSHAVTRWIAGTLRIPERVFLRVVDIVLEEQIKALLAKPPAMLAAKRPDPPPGD